MKKFFQTVVLSLSVMAGTLIPAQRSEAAMAILMFSNLPMAIVGSVFITTGGVGAIVTASKPKPREEFVTLLGAGLILLDSPTTPMTFAAIDSDTAKKLGAQNDDVVTFNSELDEARAVGEEIAKNLVAKYGTQKEIDLNKVAQEAQNKWNKVCASEQLSAGTCRVIEAIRHQK